MPLWYVEYSGVEVMIDEKPSPQQLRYIAILAMKAGIKEPVEDTVANTAEAGRMIQELKMQIRSKERRCTHNEG
ncbi:hypothetical protein LCGC14_1868840 [marine sediment metagenome]|uniref:Uncharacterized protein n=1 Tax=marine sediment metagenome TaxID=412755 RepID=A0A0F9IJM9_9ZZZZ